MEILPWLLCGNSSGNSTGSASLTRLGCSVLVPEYDIRRILYGGKSIDGPDLKLSSFGIQKETTLQVHRRCCMVVHLFSTLPYCHRFGLPTKLPLHLLPASRVLRMFEWWRDHFLFCIPGDELPLAIPALKRSITDEAVRICVSHVSGTVIVFSDYCFVLSVRSCFSSDSVMCWW